MSVGAQPGHKTSAETRAKISASLMGRKGHQSNVGRKEDPEVTARRAAHLRSPFTICTIEGCGKAHQCRGLCKTHYSRLMQTGTTDDPPERVGELAQNWSGDNVGYHGVHIRARKILPKQCRVCGATEARLQVALRHDAASVNLRTHDYLKNGTLITLAYSVKTDEYVRLCETCHRQYDSPIEAKRLVIIEALTH